MRMLIAAAALALIPVNVAHAQCIGTSSFRTCTDASGNTYTTTRSGNMSTTYGSNPSTGSTWSQQSYRSGNMTNTYGTDSNGRSWNSTTTPYGTYGTDARGNSFYSPYTRPAPPPPRRRSPW